jgi:hypothetical protein
MEQLKEFRIPPPPSLSSLIRIAAEGQQAQLGRRGGARNKAKPALPHWAMQASFKRAKEPSQL